VDFRQLTSPADRVAVVATTPLTDNENWVTHPSGYADCSSWMANRRTSGPPTPVHLSGSSLKVECQICQELQFL
jgi:hypothetical protein